MKMEEATEKEHAENIRIYAKVARPLIELGEKGGLSLQRDTITIDELSDDHNPSQSV